jgi:uncharacterized coiled-coil protein SlyX
MSIALHQRIKELERLVAEHRLQLDSIAERLKALEAKRPPGRPPKNG